MALGRSRTFTNRYNMMSMMTEGDHLSGLNVHNNNATKCLYNSTHNL